MGHLVGTIRNTTLSAAIASLTQAHSHLVSSARAAVQFLDGRDTSWGADAKRLVVDLAAKDGGALLEKSEERFVEVVNMAATLERLVDTLSWFQNNTLYRELQVSECHPSTSDDAGGNDLVLVASEGAVRVRCEVCDVVSSNAGQNSKERKDLKNLGCNDGVPVDGIDRFIATSPEFAQALTSPSRKWKDKSYRYELIPVSGARGTHLLKLGRPDEKC